MTYCIPCEHTLVPNPTENITAEKIEIKSCEFFGIPSTRLKSKSRKRELVIARQMSIAMIRKYTTESLKTIGARFGGRDHTSCIHSIKTIQDLCDTDEMIKLKLNQFEKFILAN